MNKCELISIISQTEHWGLIALYSTGLKLSVNVLFPSLKRKSRLTDQVNALELR